MGVALLLCMCSRSKSAHYEGVALQRGGSDWEGFVRSNPEEGISAGGFSTVGRADSAVEER